MNGSSNLLLISLLIPTLPNGSQLEASAFSAHFHQSQNTTESTESTPSKALPAFRKTPYLIMEQHGQGLSVAWQTYQIPKKVTFAWGPTPQCNEGEEPMQPIATGKDENRFIFTFGLLPPGTKVYYRIQVDGVTHHGSFQNAPKEEQDEFSFYALGGTWNHASGFYNITDRMLTDLNTDSPKRQTFCIHTGNFVPSGLDERQWDQYFFSAGNRELFTRLPFLPALGYHEGIGPDGSLNDKQHGALLRKYFSPLISNKAFYYTFCFGPIQGFVLDPYTEGFSKQSPQYQALEKALSTSNHPWKIVVIHDPIWSAQGTTPWQGQAQPNNERAQKELCPLFEKYGVQLVLHGRNAYYARAEVKKVTYLTLGNAGHPSFTPDPKAPNLEKSASEPHYARFDLDGKRMKVSVFNEGGKELDSFKLKR